MQVKAGITVRAAIEGAKIALGAGVRTEVGGSLSPWVQLTMPWGVHKIERLCYRIWAGRLRMTTVKQLYALQEVDLDLDRVYKALERVEEEMKTEVSIGNLEVALRDEEERLQEVELRQREGLLEAEARRDRSETLETQLYDGTMVSARDLEALQQEAASVRHQIEQDESLSLELSIQAEESQVRCANLSQQLSENKSRWEVQQMELNKKATELRAEQTEYERQRELLAGRFDPATLQRYETLRKSKGGRAVAKVERDLCQGCRMSLPTQLRQRVKSGRQTVNCSSCGRMLFVE